MSFPAWGPLRAAPVAVVCLSAVVAMPLAGCGHAEMGSIQVDTSAEEQATAPPLDVIQDPREAAALKQALSRRAADAPPGAPRP